MEFTGDSFHSGLSSRLFNILGEVYCEPHPIVFGVSLLSVCIIAVLEEMRTI